MNKPPAFQFYPGDWLASTKISLMTPAEEGAYIRLLCHAWSDPQCSLPDDDDILASLSRLGPEWFNGASTKIRACFKKKGNKLHSERLEIEKKKQREWRKKSKLGGLNSGKLRKNKELGSKGGSHLLETKDEPKGNSSSSSSSSLKGIKNKGSFSDENTSCPLSFKEFFKTNSSDAVISNFKDVAEAVKYFLSAYKKYRAEEHPKLKPEQWYEYIMSMSSFYDYYIGADRGESSVDELRVMIDAYFQKQYRDDCDYRLAHFVSAGVFKNLFYENVYNQ